MMRMTFLLLLFIITSCNMLNVSEPQLNFYDEIDFGITNEGYVIGFLDKAKSSAYVSLYSLTPSIASKVNSLIQRGVRVRVLIDNLGSPSGVNTSVLVSGNVNGDMSANFVVIDGIESLVLSTHSVTNQFFFVRIKNEYVANDLISEFNQMYRFGRYESSKVVYNNAKVYRIANNSVRIVFVPQEDFMNVLETFISQSSENFVSYFRSIDNNNLYYYLYNSVRYSPNSRINVGINFTNGYTNYAGILQKTRVFKQPIWFNIMVSSSELEDGIALTTFDFTKNLNVKDGVIVMFYGPVATRLKEFLTSYFSSVETTNLSGTAGEILTSVPYTNIVVSEINWVGAFDNNGTSYPYAEFIEIKNISTNYYDISGYSIVITNANNPTSPTVIGIPGGTILPPGSFLVIGRKNYVPNAFSYYDILSEDLSLVNSGFSVTILSPYGQTVDIAGNHTSSPLAGTTSNPRRTMVRKLDVIDHGYLSTSWYNATNKLNINPNYISNTFATPGGD
ncbi:MAG: hypothetical protein RMJ37_06520 [Spirochaetia bacterium]|nr:hypothetical protein [Spirochaetota bacterium]MDW8112968.1 hypothetical protein [Spirochaetia bacterium]